MSGCYDRENIRIETMRIEQGNNGAIRLFALLFFCSRTIGG